MKNGFSETRLVILLLCLALAIGIYWTARFGGQSLDGDTTRLTLAGEGTALEGTITPSRWSYPNGFGLPVLLAFLSQVTLIPVQKIQLVAGLWMPVIVLSAYLVYREFLQDTRLSAAAVLFLLLQPDFVFYILRGSHEKTTWTFGLLILWLWIRNLQRLDFSRLIGGILAVYLLLWSMIANNAYFSSTLIVMYLIGLVAMACVTWWSSRYTLNVEESVAGQRMVYIFLIGLGMVFIFITYLYPPAKSYYFTLNSVVDRLSALLLGGETASQPYTYVQSAWRSFSTYLLLTVFQWLIVLAGVMAWLRDGLRILTRDKTLISRPRLLFWCFYSGIAIQLLVAVIIDFTGILGSNLQVRLFVPFAILTSPLAATWISEIRTFHRIKMPAQVLISLLVAIAFSFVLIKVTNDPIVANQWIFYNPREQWALDWIETHISHQEIWLDNSIHKLDVLRFRRGYSWEPANRYVFGPSLPTSYTVIADSTVLQANRSVLPLPNTDNQIRVYDNGKASIYHKLPRTPFQR